MNDNDELNDSAVLSAVRDSIAGLPMPAAPCLEAITARGSARRRRRLGGVELSIGYRQDPGNSEISFTLIQAGAPLTCTSIPDNGPHGQ